MPSTNTSPASNPHFGNIDRAPYEFGYLLRRLPADFFPGIPLEPEVLLRASAAADHAYNANCTLMIGLEALGKLMFVASSNQQLDADTVSDIGCLIQHIAIEAQFLQETENALRSAIGEQP